MASWEDFLTHILTTTVGVDKVIIYDTRGRPAGVTEGVETSDSEGFALVKTLNDPAKTMTKLTIDGNNYVCVQGIHHSLVGTCVRPCNQLVVALQDAPDGHVIALVGQQGQGSFIATLRKALMLKEQGLLLNPERMQQQQQEMLPINPPVEANSVLVEI